MSLMALSEGMPGLSPARGATLAEAAAICLEARNHKTRVRLPRAGVMSRDLYLAWPPTDAQKRHGYADMQEATEWGAYGIAILVVKEVTGMVVIERSRKCAGFDYWVGGEDYDGLPFAGASRLEVSGILVGTENQMDARIRQKRDQMSTSDHLAPGFVAVVEFGTPMARVEHA